MPQSKQKTAKQTVQGYSVGLKSTGLQQVLNQIRTGLKFQALSRLQKQSGIGIQKLADVVRIPERTLARRKQEGRFRSDETERLLRFAFLFEKALACFSDDQDATRSWLERPNAALGDEAPLRLAETEFGARAVEDLIGRLEHGVFS